MHEQTANTTVRLNTIRGSTRLVPGILDTFPGRLWQHACIAGLISHCPRACIKINGLRCDIFKCVFCFKPMERKHLPMKRNHDGYVYLEWNIIIVVAAVVISWKVHAFRNVGKSSWILCRSYGSTVPLSNTGIMVKIYQQLPHYLTSKGMLILISQNKTYKPSKWTWSTNPRWNMFLLFSLISQKLICHSLIWLRTSFQKKTEFLGYNESLKNKKNKKCFIGREWDTTFRQGHAA